MRKRLRERERKGRETQRDRERRTDRQKKIIPWHSALTRLPSLPGLACMLGQP
jgi:hypothetical protein